ncbi:WD repeat-containing protein 60 [Myotis brandtii]|uniref:WD repeat-containing protein 60 n=1 Tax=Myotis brandtii TaxID=109478 RepID=S7MJQ1_MYOBR|nr:WD repeat-containing protein 60 [Myotis brandtii]
MSPKWALVCSHRNAKCDTSVAVEASPALLLAGEQDTVAAGGFEAVTLRNPFLFLALAAQSTLPREDKKHKEKKLHKDLETDAPESKEQKPRDPDRDAKHRERVADRDRHGSREYPRGDRDKEKPRERRRDARDLDREKLRDKAREHDTEKHQSRGKDRERDREREGEHRVRREEPKPVARHHWPEHRMRSVSKVRTDENERRDENSERGDEERERRYRERKGPVPVSSADVSQAVS